MNGAEKATVLIVFIIATTLSLCFLTYICLSYIEADKAIDAGYERQWERGSPWSRWVKKGKE